MTRDVKVVLRDDLDNETVYLNPQGKVSAKAVASRLSEVIDVLSLDWKPYQGTTTQQAKWTFFNNYTRPFITQMATANAGLGAGQPVVYIHDLKSNEVTFVIATGVLTTLRGGTRKLQVMVEEANTFVAPPNAQPSSGTTVTPEIVNQYIVQNLEIVDNIGAFHDGWGNMLENPFGINVEGRRHMIDRVGRIKGTNWLVFGSSTL